MRKPFDLLASAAAFARERGIPLIEPALIDEFTANAARRLKLALGDPTLIHGTRAENLSEAMTLSRADSDCSSGRTSASFTVLLRAGRRTSVWCSKTVSSG
jgi:hypothetical protein